MTAIIITGGKGSRMKPLNSVCSKHELKICGKSILDYITEKLRNNGIDEMIYTHSEYLRADPVSLVRATAGNMNETAVAVCSDVLCAMDYRRAFIMHKRWGKSITLLYCGGVFTGNFIFEPHFFEKFPALKGDVYSLEGKLGYLAAEYNEDCFFIDINTPSDYMAAGKAVLYRKYIPDIPFEENAFVPKGTYADTAETEAPVYIGKSCVIDSGAVIAQGTLIGDCVYIGKGAHIDGGIIMNGAYIGERVRVKDAVVCENARLLSGAQVYRGAVMGSGASAGENSRIYEGVRVWNGRRVAPEQTASSDIVYSGGGRSVLPLMFDSEGRMCGECGGVINPKTAAAMGSAAVQCGRTVIIGHRNGAASKALAYAFAAGVSAAGGEAIISGELSEPALRYGTIISGAGCGCYIDGGVSTSVRLCAADGLSVDEELGSRIEQAVDKGEYCSVGHNHYGRISYLNDIYKMYNVYLNKLVVSDISGIYADVSCSDSVLYSFCREKLSSLGADNKSNERIAFHISADGRKISAYSDETGYVFHDKLVMLAIKRLSERGVGSIGVSSDIPKAADQIAPVLRYKTVPDYREMSSEEISADKKARNAAAKLPFSEDGCAVMLIVLDHLAALGISLKKAVSELPSYAAAERFIPVRGSAAQLKELIGRAGISDRDENISSGRVIIKPVRTGGGIMMHIESTDIEAAAELCDFYEDLIGRL